MRISKTIKPRPKLQKKLNALNTHVLNNKEQALLKITKTVFKWIDNPNTQINSSDNIEALTSLLYQALEKIYADICSDLKNIYTQLDEFHVDDISKLSYQEDGKTLEERIITYLNDMQDKRENNIDAVSIKSYCINMYDRILNNEAAYLKHTIMSNKLSKKASILVIEGGNSCGSCGPLGEYPADEDIILPPYHTNCQCSCYWVETDDEDDITDLDLEVED